MAPVVDIDDGALAGDAQEGGVDHVAGRLPGRAHNTVSMTIRTKRQGDQRSEALQDQLVASAELRDCDLW